MKRIFLIVVCFFVSMFSYSQQDTDQYKALRKIADSLYRAKDYNHAASNYSIILRLPNLKPSIWDWNNAAFSWSMAGFPDSAFFNLEKIARTDTVSFSNYLDIVTDNDYTTLRSLTRWFEITDSIFNNARHTFLAALNSYDQQTAFRQYYYATQAWIINKGPDSALKYLNKLVISDVLTFMSADEILKNERIKELTADNKWHTAVEKMFKTLERKYIPENYFKKGINQKILIDGAHFNFHDINGTYEVVAGMLRQKGFIVTGLTEKIDDNYLKDANILIIANPASDRMDSLTKRAQRSKEPYRWSSVATQSAFTMAEVTSIKNWVYNGGSLLLILDHAPVGKSASILVEAFGAECRNVGTYDTLSLDPTVDTTRGVRDILFTRSKGVIGKHSIMSRVDSLTTYTGLSLVGPPNSSELLILPSTAYDRDWLPETRQFRHRSAAGRSQGIALEYGKGRLVLLGEAAQFRPVFLSRSDRGNWQFLLNIVKWLSKSEMK